MHPQFTRLFAITLFVCLFAIVSCLKKNYEGPPDISGYDPKLPVTNTIEQLLSKPKGAAITGDITVYGIVTMNDKSGNCFNKLVVQDSTAGIEILIDESNLYNDYPVGRKVYIKCKGLYLGNDSNNPQLGAAPDNTGNLSAIPATLADDYIVKANYPNAIVPDTLTIAQLSANASSYLNRLVAIKNVEFTEAHAGVPYAAPASLSSSTSHPVQDCNRDAVSLRTSGFAKFQPYLTPKGNGTLTGIFTKYNTSIQIYIRDTNDVHFDGSRCGSGNQPLTITRLATLRALAPSFSDSVNTLHQMSVTGIVISDKDGANIISGNLVLQDGDKGIVIRFSGNHSFALGDSLVMDLTGGKLSWYNNLLQVSNIAATKAVKYASGKMVRPKIATIAQCISNYNEWESTLVKINNASVTSTGTYSGTKTITDVSGSMALYTRSTAAFSSAVMPTTPKSFTCTLGIFSTTKQLQIRNLNDVQ
jgi:hypothetical protein